jgi:hypothetical protein
MHSKEAELMSQLKTNALVVLRRLVEALDSLSEEELKKMSDPQYSIEFKAIRRRSKDESKLHFTDANAEEAITQLSMFSSRQDAQVMLDDKYPSKKVLEVIARKLDIPITRQDKIEDLRDKIVEATVGAKIRSQAIQGTTGGE